MKRHVKCNGGRGEGANGGLDRGRALWATSMSRLSQFSWHSSSRFFWLPHCCRLYHLRRVLLHNTSLPGLSININGGIMIDFKNKEPDEVRMIMIEFQLNCIGVACRSCAGGGSKPRFWRVAGGARGGARGGAKGGDAQGCYRMGILLLPI